MPDRPLRILQVNTCDGLGGAERVALGLHRKYLERGLSARMAVGTRLGSDPAIAEIPNEAAKAPHVRALLRAVRRLECAPGRGARLLRLALRLLAEPRRTADGLRGREDFRHPGTARLLELFPEPPDLLHGHNLHGGYFDLRALPELSRRLPVLLTLHDTWLLAGHCAHSLECARWQTGCGHCPDLAGYPAVRRDATAFNWRRKRDLYARSRLYVAAPCRWLLDRLEKSILAPAVREARVIPNGVDLEVFRPADRRGARAELGLPPDARLLLFAANRPRSNPWKDWPTVQAAVAGAAERWPGPPLLLLALGEAAPAERLGRAEARFIPYQHELRTVARYYQAADLCVHAARADTFPNTVLEAQACGLPVAATAVDGIPEQVRGLDPAAGGPEEATGILTPPGDPGALAAGILKLLGDEELRARLGANAAAHAARHFGLDRQAEAYLAWYRQILAEPGAAGRAAATGA